MSFPTMGEFDCGWDEAHRAAVAQHEASIEKLEAGLAHAQEDMSRATAQKNLTASTYASGLIDAYKAALSIVRQSKP